jgi:hypothetical protein
VVRLLADKDALRPRLGIDKATDILWTVNHPDVWRLLVSERRWTAGEYEAWTADTACVQLLQS